MGYNSPPVNTDYWSFMDAGKGVNASPTDGADSGVLPAMWWLGGLIILIVIRVAYELMD